MCCVVRCKGGGDEGGKGETGDVESGRSAGGRPITERLKIKEIKE
jgi:hypothetical protein